MKPPEAAAVPIPPKDPPGVPFPGGSVSRSADGAALVAFDSSVAAKQQGGSEWAAFNKTLLETVMSTIPTSRNDPEAATNRIAAASAALATFAPANEIESMIAAQAVALHYGALECLRRAMLPDQHADVASKLRKDGANLARAMTDMLDALDRKRGRGPQVVRVERVVVHEGGQAVVGNVQPAVVPKAGG
jgi:hypothetical protein